MLDEASQVIATSHELKQKSQELMHATAELRAANERLQELDRMKDDFVSTVTHELRTPLTSIRAFSEILHDNPELDADERQKFLNIIIQESERLTRLINQVLDLAKLESGRAEWQVSDVDLKGVIEDSIDATGQLFRAGNVALEMHLPAEARLAHADRDRLVQVLINLLSNAVKFVRPDEGRVSVRLSDHAGSLRVEVADNGPGISLGKPEDHFREIPPGRRYHDREAPRHGARFAHQPPDHRALRRSTLGGERARRRRGLPVRASTFTNPGPERIRIRVRARSGHARCHAAGVTHGQKNSHRRRRTQYRGLARVSDEAKRLRRESRHQWGGRIARGGRIQAGPDPPRRDDAALERLRRVPEGAGESRVGRRQDHHAFGQGTRCRGEQGNGRRRRRLCDQALFDQGPDGDRTRKCSAARAMRDNVRFLLALAAAWGFVLLALAATALLVDLDLGADEHALAVEILRGRAAHVVIAALLLLAPLAFLVRALFRRYVNAPRQLAEDARVMLTANPAHRAALRGSRETKRLAAGLNTLRRRARVAEAGCRGARARGQRAHRAGTQAPRGADVGARAKRDRVQRRGTDPALQRAGDAASAQAARRGGRGWRRAEPGRTRPLGLRRFRSQPDRACAGKHPRSHAPGRAQPGGELRHHGARGPAGARADGAGAGRGCRRRGRRRGRGHHRLRAVARQHHPPHRGRQPPRYAAPDADPRNARVAGQRARRDRDHGVIPRDGHRGAQPLHRHHRRGSAADERRTRPGCRTSSPTRCAPNGRSRTCAAPT